MAGITRSTCVTRAKTLLNEKGVLMWTAAQINDLADEANRLVYQEIVERCPDFFISGPTSVTWPANTETRDITTQVLSAEPYRLVSIVDTPESGAISPTNRPTEWVPMRFYERVGYLYEGDTQRYRYCLAGVTLYVAPIPTAARYVKVWHIPQLAALAGDSTEMLGGLGEPFSNHCVYALAFLANAKQANANPAIVELWERAKADLTSQASTRVSDRPTFITFSGPRRTLWAR